ncbi:DnaJ C-terminal domain-containing protein [Isoptericola cucumis]|uniref:Molecular chaperone DnaJ n=1 Tax=Isoptericola cucumis TaxID=1776856 RepID=A0ABQ2B4Y0_9MICO|nr:DnaJ C-terminal domain-containing protein [Isoptericola cucumis]GGI05157.1 molecular chaperone DnaJ [Isoptericola cucumis]
MTGQDWIEKDFYAALGVPKDADDAAVKKAYRKLARKYHPDQNPGDAAAEAKFKEIGEAYAVLSDPEQRQQYDAVRTMAGGGARFAAGPGGGGNGFEDVFGSMFGGGAGPNVRYSQAGYGGAGGGFEDILSQMLGGQGGARTGRPAGFGAPPQQRGADVAARASLPFRTAVEGSTVDLTVDGRKLTVRIPAGVNDGQKIKIPGRGRPGVGGGPAGDLVVTVHVEPHPVYTLDGADLRMTVPVTFGEAALGTTIEVPTIDGKHVRVKVPSGTPSGRVLRVKGRGIATKKGAGDLLVTVQVVVPQKLTKQAKEALEAFTAASDHDDVRADLARRAAQ